MSKDTKDLKNKKNKKKRNNKEKRFGNYNMKWILLITLWTFLLAICVSVISESIMRNLDIFAAFIALMFIIFLGVFFDTIGIAVAASNERPFHSMAANNIREAKYAIKLIRNAGPVSNFCNDVVGDISGIVSGAAGTFIITRLVGMYGLQEGAIISILMSAFVASITVGGKAFGKEVAINNSEKIIFYTSKFVMFMDVKIGVSILPELKKKKNKRKSEDKRGRYTK